MQAPTGETDRGEEKQAKQLSWAALALVRLTKEKGRHAQDRPSARKQEQPGRL